MWYDLDVWQTSEYLTSFLVYLCMTLTLRNSVFNVWAIFMGGGGGGGVKWFV